MDRRGFLGAILAAGAAPYVMSGGIGRGVLMPVTASRDIVLPTLSEIIQTTIDVHSERLAANIYQTNALMKYLILTQYAGNLTIAGPRIGLL